MAQNLLVHEMTAWDLKATELYLMKRACGVTTDNTRMREQNFPVLDVNLLLGVVKKLLELNCPAGAGAGGGGGEIRCELLQLLSSSTHCLHILNGCSYRYEPFWAIS